MNIHSSLAYALPMVKRATSQKPRKTWRRLYIAEWLKALEMKAVDVSARGGISESQLSLLAKGSRAYTQASVEKIAKGMGVDPGVLFHLPGDPNLLAALGKLTEADKRRAARMIAAMAEEGPPRPE